MTSFRKILFKIFVHEQKNTRFPTNVAINGTTKQFRPGAACYFEQAFKLFKDRNFASEKLWNITQSPNSPSYSAAPAPSVLLKAKNLQARIAIAFRRAACTQPTQGSSSSSLTLESHASALGRCRCRSRRRVSWLSWCRRRSGRF